MNTLEEGFKLLAIGSAMSYGYGFSPDSFQMLNDIIRRGVNELESNQPITPQAIEDAQKNLLKFISAAADKARVKNSPEMREEIIGPIKKLLCPLYPWISPPCP